MHAYTYIHIYIYMYVHTVIFCTYSYTYIYMHISGVFEKRSALEGLRNGVCVHIYAMDLIATTIPWGSK